MWFLILAGCFLLPGESPYEGDAPGECLDGADNDRDGLFDCEDPDCDNSPDCATDGLLGGVSTSQGGGGGTNPTNGGGCNNSLVESFPEDGANFVFYGTTVEMRPDQLTGAESIELFDDNGVQIGGLTETREDGWLVFTPDILLDPLTTYVARNSWCSGAEFVDTTWTTSEVGVPVSASSLVGRTYALDLSTGRWTQPIGVGDLLSDLLGAVGLFLGVTDANNTTLTLLGALPDESLTAQDQCSSTFYFPVASFTQNPMFEIDGLGTTISVSVDGFDLGIQDLQISGAVAPDGSYFDGVAISGLLDTRPLKGLVGGDVCDLAASVGLTCEDCPDGSGPECMTVTVDSIVAQELPGITVVERTPEDIDVLIQQGVCDYGSGACSIAAVGLGGGPLAWLMVLAALRQRRRSDP